MKKIFFLLLLLPWICTESIAQKKGTFLKNETIFVDKSPLLKYKVIKRVNQKNDFDFYNLKDSLLFSLRRIKMEYWKGGPNEEYFRMTSNSLDTLYINTKTHSGIEEIANLIVSEHMIIKDALNTTALKNLVSTHNLSEYEKRKTAANEIIQGNDSIQRIKNTIEFSFEPVFEENTILKETEYIIHHKNRKDLGYFVMKEIQINGTKDYRISFYRKNKVEIATINYKRALNYSAVSIYTRRDKVQHKIETLFTKEGIEQAANYLMRKGYF